MVRDHARQVQQHLGQRGLVDGIAAAVDGSASLGGAGDTTGLSRMAEQLRTQMTGFLAEMRS